MSEATPDRLDRIEAALDRQVAVNADLRTSVTELRATAEALLQVATIHQQNFERLTSELNADRQEWRSQIDRLWEYLLQQRGGNGSTDS
ncbi:MULTISPECIES: hypothetical protein [Calothrix]|uniref:Uncharacterized protein n=2 Tax=Calothrix TaxID=1186 RepID=A0ABR8A555_9CYAN|nr:MULTISPECIES: hypothetical protein [Calothrix]MBD2194969.1 hypothetical protein [Calothrix parietina FACHB-288]MBD2223567.1 hypothetical protein [Calothrix anomala FACHB-343]